MRVFPVDLDSSPPPTFKDEFAPRKSPKHKGIDIFAPRATPVRAVESGMVREDLDPKGGIVVYLDADSGYRYYYAHLDSSLGGFPRYANSGDLIGTVGTSGNAAGTSPHLHFQMWDPEWGLRNPYPELVRVRGQGEPQLYPQTGPQYEETPGWGRLTARGWAVLGLLLVGYGLRYQRRRRHA